MKHYKKKHRGIDAFLLLTNQSVLLNTIFIIQKYNQYIIFQLGLTILSQKEKASGIDALTTNQPKYITNKKIK